jgi:hypothetical protein
VAGTTEFSPADADFLLDSYTQDPDSFTRAILRLMNARKTA